MPGPNEMAEETKSMAMEVSGLPCFNPRGETTTLNLEWNRWKRAFDLFIVARGVTDEKQKVALLLHTGGLDLQELFFTLKPGGDNRDWETNFTVWGNPPSVRNSMGDF